MNNNDLVTAKEAASILGVSDATVKNWIKLKKLPAGRQGATFLIHRKDLEILIKNLDKMELLKSRRNKTLQKENYVPVNYISKNSPNFKIICHIVEYTAKSGLNRDQILFYYGKLLMDMAKIPENVSASLLEGLCMDSFNNKKKDDSFFMESPLSLVDGEDTLGMLYISLRRMQDKKSTGSYYTPYTIADILIKKAMSSHSKKEYGNLKIADPSCGTGNFLIRLSSDIPLDNIYGSDIDTTAVLIARINLAIKYRIKTIEEVRLLESNIDVRDFLSSPPREDYSVIIGNPPWGYSFNSEELSRLNGNFKILSGSVRPESFSLFLEKAVYYDEVTFLLPETILGSDTHSPIRELIYDNSVISSVSYLGDVFDKVQCPCIILSMDKNNTSSDIEVSFYKKNRSDYEPEKNFDVPYGRITKKTFNILSDNEEYKIIEKMQSCPHFTLKNRADFALGIVTGNNKGLIYDKKIPGSEPIIKGTDISKFGLKAPTSFVINNPDGFQQVAPMEYYRHPEKLVYKFISSGLCFALDPDKMLSLNSANIMIPKIEGYSSAYIMAILNSSSMDFYYRHTFRNMKVLRSALESLPIPLCSEDKMQEISDISLRIHSLIRKTGKADDFLVKKLDKMVANLYNLSTE
jgi:excisionase family DNA binding protein